MNKWMAGWVISLHYFIFIHINIQWLLITHKFCICEFAYWLKFTCNPSQNSQWLCSRSQIHTCTEWWKLWGVSCTCFQLRLNRWHSAFLAQLTYYKKLSFCDLINAMFSSFLCFFWWFSFFKMTPRHSAKLLCGLPMCRKAVMCLTEKIHVLNRLLSGMSYRAAGCEFNVNESAIHILMVVFKQKHT